MQDIVDGPESIRAAIATDHKAAIYIPYAADIEIGIDMRGYDIVMIDLTDRHVLKPDVRFNKGRTIVEMSQVNSDVILLGIK